MWESNPNKDTSKLLNHKGRRLKVGSIQVQNRGELFDYHSPGIPPARGCKRRCHPQIGVSELRLCFLGRRSVVEKHCCVSMAEGVESAPQNFEFVEDRRERLPHDILRDEVMPPIVEKEPFAF